MSSHLSLPHLSTPVVIQPEPGHFLKRASLLQRFGVASLAILLAGQTLLVGAARAQTTDPALEAAPATPVPEPEPLAVPATPEAEPAPEAAPLPSTSLNESYIDSTDYSLGATQRSSELATAPGRVAPSSSLSGPLGSVAGSGDSLSVVQPAPSLSLKDYYYRTVRPPARLGNGNIRLIFPLSIPAVISSAFGWRVHPISGDQRFHAGTDLAAPLGTPVLAAYAGRVAIADFLGGYGLSVALEHGKGNQQTLYAHLSEIFVKPGEVVPQGAVIGRVGSTGNSTGPHLHFEFRQLTPEGWVALDAGTQLEYALAQLVKSMQVAQGKPQSGLDLGIVNVGAKGEGVKLQS